MHACLWNAEPNSARNLVLNAKFTKNAIKAVSVSFNVANKGAVCVFSCSKMFLKVAALQVAMKAAMVQKPDELM